MAAAVSTPRDGGALVEALWQALAEVPDPEIPVVSVVDLGMVERLEADETGAVRVTLLPTFVGCPALGLIRQGVARRLQAVPGVREVEVGVAYSPPWSTGRITPEGRRKLASFGIAPPPPVATATLAPQDASDPGGPPAPCRAARRLAEWIPFRAPAGRPAGEPGTGTEGTPCPFCGSRRTRLENAFGPTPCRSLWYCLDCRNPFEQMKVL
ncbi:phenylacetate-CoA oxygenase, PaaJ subunit [Thermaerobacter marianensis DSM 12885]|uniref:Phenylacetate-CoA oxygenase, PaaJ subunit n=1 Tax=Thermaerobacter marianensis (strain ATCC 700841 / DSM 12885 / JCM 10246 / 7p75a) TaxID=644966 RepID=E6SJY1_THEM7|nr:iron-sulfur cluster assembly protein [Thermaerobacter marianensis]ADU52214.1 phenylacetate-CoA oxygenase, PaaJ subunit [Thermaerobacter marianensis DSM 12885]